MTLHVIRENLWYKMIKAGVNEKILTKKCSVYNCVKMRVLNNGVMSDPFYCSLGVRQGECLYPLLFSLYINDLEECLNVPGSDGGPFEAIDFFVCRWCFIFAESTELLQTGIDMLYSCCEQWRLKLNTQNSKILVFRKGKRFPTEVWILGEHVLECSRNISYLELLFSSHGLLTASSREIGRAGK